jgi:hypothetical protein
MLPFQLATIRMPHSPQPATDRADPFLIAFGTRKEDAGQGYPHKIFATPSGWSASLAHAMANYANGSGSRNGQGNTAGGLQAGTR